MAKKDNFKPKHDEIDVPNLEVLNLMRSARKIARLRPRDSSTGSTSTGTSRTRASSTSASTFPPAGGDRPRHGKKGHRDHGTRWPGAAAGRGARIGRGSWLRSRLQTRCGGRRESLGDGSSFGVAETMVVAAAGWLRTRPGRERPMTKLQAARRRAEVGDVVGGGGEARSPAPAAVAAGQTQHRRGGHQRRVGPATSSARSSP